MNTVAVPLNKFIAAAGLCSRRKAVAMITDGQVTVNGKVIVEPAHRVTASDIVKVGEKRVQEEKKVYILLNKPKDYVTTVEDERGRRTVMDLVQDAPAVRLYPVGRLDRNTTGLLIMTNDGEFAQRLAHPRNGIAKIYHVELSEPLRTDSMCAIRKGLYLEDGPAVVDRIAYVAGKRKNNVVVELHSGKYRVVRRIFEHLGYKVSKLDRVSYAGITKQGLASGHWRFVSGPEVAALSNLSENYD